MAGRRAAAGRAPARPRRICAAAHRAPRSRLRLPLDSPRARAAPRRPRSARPPSSTGRCARPYSRPASVSATSNRLSWSGPSWPTTSYGRRLQQRLRALLQARLEVAAARAARRPRARPNRRAATAARRLEARRRGRPRPPAPRARSARIDGRARPPVLLLAPPEEDPPAQIDRRGDLRQAGLADQRGARARQLALARGREAAHQQVADDQRQHGVAEELEPLVVGRARTAVASLSHDVWVSAVSHSAGRGRCARAALRARRSGFVVLGRRSSSRARSYRDMLVVSCPWPKRPISAA